MSADVMESEERRREGKGPRGTSSTNQVADAPSSHSSQSYLPVRVGSKNDEGLSSNSNLQASLSSSSTASSCEGSQGDETKVDVGAKAGVSIGEGKEEVEAAAATLEKQGQDPTGFSLDDVNNVGLTGDDQSKAFPPNLSELKLGEAGAQGTDAAEGPVKLFVGGLAWETTEASLQKVFENYGEIVEVSIMRHPSTMCSRGFGFVTLAKRSDAEAACNDKHTIDGRVVEAKISVTPGQNSPGGSSQAASKRRKVFVGGLSAETTDEDFRKYFEQFGEISESQILQDHYTGRSRGFGFITFTTDEATQKVFSKGRFHELKGKLVEVKSATPRQQNKGNSRGRGIRSNKPQSANANRGGGGVVGNMRRNYPYGVTPQGGVPYGMDPSTGYSYPGYFPSYNQVMPGPYVYGTDAGVSTVSPVPGYAQNAGYSMGSFPVPPQGTQPGGFIVPPQFVHPGTANGNELDPTGVLMPMPVPQTIAMEGTRAPVQQQTVLPDGITE